MSFDIIYNRQFIKVDENQVIPFLEMGSNNCYEASGNGRKRARDWGSSLFLTNGKIITNNEDLLKEIDKLEESTKQNCIENTKQYGEGWEYDSKRFGYHTGISFYGKSTSSTSFSAFKSYHKNGIKEAMTIEELLEYDIKISLNVYRWVDKDITDKGLEIKPNVTFTSTQHMIDTINEYESYYGNKVTLYLRCNGDWLIERMKKTKNRNKVVNRKEKKSVEVNEYFILRNENGGYFVRNTARGYKYSYFASSSSVKSFMSEKQAESFKKKMRNGDLFVIEKRECSYVFNV